MTVTIGRTACRHTVVRRRGHSRGMGPPDLDKGPPLARWLWTGRLMLMGREEGVRGDLQGLISTRMVGRTRMVEKTNRSGGHTVELGGAGLLF